MFDEEDTLGDLNRSIILPSLSALSGVKGSIQVRTFSRECKMWVGRWVVEEWMRLRKIWVVG
jgi:hypothetical protein